MGTLRTHYDNLMVARNAAPEIIIAAYRQLSLRYHPDRNPDDPDAERIMAIINHAYAVLSDPAKRREHDLWIEGQERRAASQPSGSPAEKAPQNSNQASYGKLPNWIIRNLPHLARETMTATWAFGLFVLAIVGAGITQSFGGLSLTSSKASLASRAAWPFFDRNGNALERGGETYEEYSARRDSYDGEYGSFAGYGCTQDCSGHKAGYRWAEDQGIDDLDDCGGKSWSFIEGCQAYVDEHKDDGYIDDEI